MKYTNAIAVAGLLSLLLVTDCNGSDSKKEPAADTVKDTVSASADKLTIYYFHTTFRCWTCNQFEKLTKEVLAESYADKVSDSIIEFKVINVENGKNKHFVDDYRLVTKSLILSLGQSGKQVQWKNLEQIWQLARDAEKFKTYVRKGIDEYLKKVG